MRRLRAALPVLIFLVWSALIGGGLLAATLGQGVVPVDFATYQRAMSALARGASPYQTPAESRAVWRTYHRLDLDLRAAYTRGEKSRLPSSATVVRDYPGPYLYLPTLALLIGQLRVTPAPWEVLDLLVIVGFPLLWLRVARASWWWLLLVVASWDVWATYTGGNVEGLLLAATLLAARLLWPPRPLGWASPLLAAALIVFELLAKPFYALFFIAFGLILACSGDESARASRRDLVSVVGLVVLLLAVEVARWGLALRAEALGYLAHSLNAQWFVLPVGEQTPMSAWNRTPFQALIGLGLPAPAAQGGAAMVWALALVVTIWRLRARRVSFAGAFALAFTLLYLGRPVGWTLAYLDLVVVVAVWPLLPRAGRALLLVGTLALLASHWAALVLTGMGDGLPLLTLQPADRPFETWLVLPLAWALTLWAATRKPA